MQRKNWLGGGLCGAFMYLFPFSFFPCFFFKVRIVVHLFRMLKPSLHKPSFLSLQHVV